MTVYTWPSDIIPYSSSFYLQHNSVVFESPLTKTQQVFGRPGERFVCESSFLLTRKLASKLDALLVQIKGPQNTVKIWPFSHSGSVGDDWDTGPTDILTTLDFTDDTDFTDTTGFIYSRSYGPYVISESPLMIGGFAGSVEAIVPGDFLSINDSFLMVQTASDTTGPDGELGLSVRGTYSAEFGDEPDFEYPLIEMRITSDDVGMNTRSMQSGDGFVIPYSIQFVQVLV